MNLYSIQAMDTNKIDSQAFIDSSVQLGSYSTIRRANITTHSQIGDYATINNNVLIDYAKIGTNNNIGEKLHSETDSYPTVNNGAKIGMYIKIGENVTICQQSGIGSNATVDNNTDTRASTIKTYNEMDENAFIAHCQFGSNKTSSRLFSKQVKTNEYPCQNLTVENTHSSRLSNIDSDTLQFMCVILVLSFLERLLR